MWYAIGGILGLLFVIAMNSMRSAAPSRKCPYCAEAVLPEATVCKHCHKELVKPGKPPVFRRD